MNLEVDDEIKENSLIDFEMKRIKNKTYKPSEIDEFGEIKEKVLVKQSYDKKLSNDEKAAMNKVINEEKDYKEKLELLKKKKERDREERLERIKKMRSNL